MTISAETMTANPSGSRWERDVYSQGRHLNRYPSEMVVSFVFSHVAKLGEPRGRRVLDLGCGAGNNVWFLAREGYGVAGIDESVSAIDFARTRLADEGLSADLRVGDFSELPWDDGAFDVAIDRGSITCNRRKTIEATLDEVKRVLKPSGLFLSQMLGWEHGGRPFGQDLGDGCYDNFSKGYFADLTKVFFADTDAINSLYGSRFEILSQEHMTIERGDEARKSAYWSVICRRT